MRCDNCPYSVTSYWDESYWSCSIFGETSPEITENRDGECGCRYNKITLEKKERENEKWWEEQQKKEMEEYELRRSLKSIPKGIIKLKGMDEFNFRDFLVFDSVK